MEDEKIIDLFFARDEQAVAETDRKYGPYCFTVAHAVLKNDQDAEEVVSDTYLRAWNAIPPRRPNILRLFLAKITRNLAFTRWRSQSAAKRGGGELELVLEELSECITDGRSIDDRLAFRELSSSIRRFLDTIPQRDQNIFLRRYFYVEETASIARNYGMKPATVQKNLVRTRAKLKDYLQREGYAV